MRLISYNIHKGIGGRDRVYRLERIIDVLRHEEPDVLCLQEVDRNVRRSNYDDQPLLLQEALGYDHAVYQFNHRVRGGGYGNLILSRYPIRKRHNLSLRLPGRKNRRAQLAVLDTPHGGLRLVNWHLGLSDRERQTQVARLLGHESYRGYDGCTTLVAGDFNDWRNTLEAGAFAGHGLRQITAPPSRFRTFPAYMPVGALDKAFACERVKVDHAHIIRNALTRKASDHLPLVLDFELNGGQ